MDEEGVTTGAEEGNIVVEEVGVTTGAEEGKIEQRQGKKKIEQMLQRGKIYQDKTDRKTE